MVVRLVMKYCVVVFSFIIFFAIISCSNTRHIGNDAGGKTWFLECNESYDSCGYVNEKGNEMIPMGKYALCYTDIFDTYAIVLDSEKGIVGIDREEAILFKVFPFDNGPDLPKEGLFRIVDSGNKIGYANMRGEIVIKPQFECAYPFENGKAKVSKICEKSKEGEHVAWWSNTWFYINPMGEKID